MNVTEIKQKANELSELCLKDADKFAHTYVGLYDSGEFTDEELDIILKLSDVYVAVKQGYMRREEGAAEQKRILSGGKSE